VEADAERVNFHDTITSYLQFIHAASPRRQDIIDRLVRAVV